VTPRDLIDKLKNERDALSDAEVCNLILEWTNDCLERAGGGIKLLFARPWHEAGNDAGIRSPEISELLITATNEIEGLSLQAIVSLLVSTLQVRDSSEWIGFSRRAEPEVIRRNPKESENIMRGLRPKI
jgi:hypothetical protein